MATKITMPQLGESVTEGTISKWYVNVGDKVSKYDPLCEVMTDKVNAEIPSSYTGVITELVAQEEETVAVGATICYIQEEGQVEGDVSHGHETKDPDMKPHLHAGNDDMQGRYSPAVLKLAQEHNIDLKQIKGSGMGGRITRKDIQLLIEKGEAPAQKPAKDLASMAPPAQAPLRSDIEIPVTGIRRTIAQKMVQSKTEIPHAWTMIEVDVTKLVRFRDKVKDSFLVKEGVKLTYLPFFIKAVVDALREYPVMNSQWMDNKIVQKKDINISIAVATEDALYVPVIKRADEKSIFGIMREIDELAHKTRTGRLTMQDLEGGTFTVNNTGSFGSIQSVPIINFPQAAILSVESIVKRPVVIDNMIAIRDMVNLCLSLDHRILDGLVCGRFLQSIKKKLEAMGEETSIY
jgi:2-oxoisovalerate dehydrogenase E2 component (dihydrolipoyl transacylase)